MLRPRVTTQAFFNTIYWVFGSIVFQVILGTATAVLLNQNFYGRALVRSVALIPWVRTAFRGFIVGLRHEGALYRFATYTGAKIERLHLTDTHIHWTLSGQTGPDSAACRYRLAIDAERAEGGLIRAPDRHAMVARIVESLTATVAVRLARLEHGGENVILDDVGRHAGLEIAGDLPAILDAYTE